MLNATKIRWDETESEQHRYLNPIKLLWSWIEISKSGADMFILVLVANKVQR